MRIWVVVVSSVVLGSSAGFALTWLIHGGIEEDFCLQPAKTLSRDGSSEEAPKITVVGGEVYDFGTLDYNQTRTHVFVVRNEGTAQLTLQTAGVSCGKCIVPKFEKARVEPGGECKVELEFRTRKMTPQFAERLELATNDPEKKVVDLRIEGYVAHAIRCSVDELAVGAISGNEDSTASFRLYAYHSDKLEIVKHEFLLPGTADLFDLGIRNLEKGEFDDEENAKAALEVTLTIKQGLPLGPLKQTICLHAKAESESGSESEIEVSLAGKVVSDISVIGGNFNDDYSSISFGTVSVREGAKAPVRILVKGPYRDTVKLSVKSIDPSENLKVVLGDAIRSGQVVMYPLEIEVLKDAPIINRLGTKQGKSGKIVIETTHPITKEVLIYPRFALID